MAMSTQGAEEEMFKKKPSLINTIAVCSFFDKFVLRDFKSIWLNKYQINGNGLWKIFLRILNGILLLV